MAADSDPCPPSDSCQPLAELEAGANGFEGKADCSAGAHVDAEESVVQRSLFARRRPAERTYTNDSETSNPDSPTTAAWQSRRHLEKRGWSFNSSRFVPERVDGCISCRYEIDAQEIGVGGYGRVYIAKDRMCKDRRVAVKKLMRHDEENVEALQLEVDIMKVLDHPSICKLFETWVEDRVMYVVIEYLEGGDLCDLIMDKQRIEERTAAYIIQQAASALRYAHGHGIAHRDMKPENVCFCSKNPDNHRVKVIDWGLGKYFSTMRMKSSVGSGAFTAPEVIDPPAEDAGYTSACDLWSLGVMTYVLLCGKPPFFGGPMAMLRNMRAEKYPMSGPVWDGTSADAKSFIASLLRCNPEVRLPVDQLLLHPWLSRQFVEVDLEVLGQVLSNVEQFSHAPDFLSICVASVARQLDHRSLDAIYRVFCVLDTNNNGVLELEEIRNGFVTVFGEESPEVLEVTETFAQLDLDSTGGISYTEFSAAGIGENSYTQEHVLWAAFKTFDVDDNGRITTEDMRQMLARADVSQVWSERVCEEVAGRVGDQFGNADGSLNFEEWLSLMRECASQHLEESPRRRRTNSSAELEVACRSAAERIFSDDGGSPHRFGAEVASSGSIPASSTLPRSPPTSPG